MVWICLFNGWKDMTAPTYRTSAKSRASVPMWDYGQGLQRDNENGKSEHPPTLWRSFVLEKRIE